MSKYLIRHIVSRTGPLDPSRPNDTNTVFRELQDHINAMSETHELHSLAPLAVLPGPSDPSGCFSFVVVFREK